MGTPIRTSPLGRDEAVWMIRDMGWSPSDFPNSGATALMRSRFGEAIAAFSLQEAVREASAFRDTENPPQDGVDPRGQTKQRNSLKQVKARGRLGGGDQRQQDVM